MKKLIIPILAIFISSCASNEIGHSKDVNQDEINQGYSVSYNEAANQTNITAFFRFAGPNGTTLILDSSSGIELNGEALSENQLASTGCYYNKIEQGKLSDKDYVFGFTDLSGKKYENKLSFRDMEIEELPAEIKKSDGLVIHFASKPDGRNEDVHIDISDDSTSVSETYKHVFLERIKFPQEKLAQLHGKVNIKIHRTGFFDLKQHAHAGGYISTEFVLKPRQLVLTDTI